MLELAQNYAEALLSIAVDDNKVIEYQKEVKELRKIIIINTSLYGAIKDIHE